jgi:hypothetical protein
MTDMDAGFGEVLWQGIGSGSVVFVHQVFEAGSGAHHRRELVCVGRAVEEDGEAAG